MSIDSFLFLRDDRLPTCEQWQEAIDAAGLDLKLEPIADLREHTGFWPAVHHGRETGFEWYYGPINSEDFDYIANLHEHIGDRGHVCNFVTHSEMHELICALYAAAVLAQLSDGLLYEEDGALPSDRFLEGVRALKLARAVEAENKNT